MFVELLFNLHGMFFLTGFHKLIQEAAFTLNLVNLYPCFSTLLGPSYVMWQRPLYESEMNITAMQTSSSAGRSPTVQQVWFLDHKRAHFLSATIHLLLCYVMMLSIHKFETSLSLTPLQCSEWFIRVRKKGCWLSTAEWQIQNIKSLQSLEVHWEVVWVIDVQTLCFDKLVNENIATILCIFQVSSTQLGYSCPVS